MEFWKPKLNSDGKREVQIRLVPRVGETYPGFIPTPKHFKKPISKDECPMCKQGIPTSYQYWFTVKELIEAIKEQPTKMFFKNMNVLGKLIAIQSDYKYVDKFGYTHSSEHRGVACNSLIAGLNNLTLDEMKRLVTY